MPAGLTERWSMDFVHDALADGSQRGVQLDFSRPGKPVAASLSRGLCPFGTNVKCVNIVPRFYPPEWTVWLLKV